MPQIPLFLQLFLSDPNLLFLKEIQSVPNGKSWWKVQGPTPTFERNKKEAQMSVAEEGVGASILFNPPKVEWERHGTYPRRGRLTILGVLADLTECRS